MDISKLNIDCEFFSGSYLDNIVILTSKEKPLLFSSDLSEKKKILDYLDLVAACDAVHVLLIKASPEKMKRDEYTAFYRNLTAMSDDGSQLKRLNNAFDQIVLKLLTLDKLVIHVDSGEVIMRYMNVGLACDYRIVADNTLYQNPNLSLGIIPKGGLSYLLPKMLGSVTATRILLSSQDIDAEEAYRMKLVDQVVPMKELDVAAMETAHRFSHFPQRYISGVKKLLNYDVDELKAFLEYENKLLRCPVQSEIKIETSAKTESVL